MPSATYSFDFMTSENLSGRRFAKGQTEGRCREAMNYLGSASKVMSKADSLGSFSDGFASRNFRLTPKFVETSCLFSSTLKNDRNTNLI